jgi:hypothetical protein
MTEAPIVLLLRSRDETALKTIPPIHLAKLFPARAHKKEAPDALHTGAELIILRAPNIGL